MTSLNLILLPGLINDSRLWAHQISGLSDVANIIVADISNNDSMAGLAASVLQQAPPGKFLLAGLSMGGYVAFEIMRQEADRVQALALLDTTARPDTPEATAGRKKMMDQSQTDFLGVVENLLPKFIHPSHLNDASKIETIKTMARSMGSDAFIRQQRAIIGRLDSRVSLADIKCPTLILCGREDEITPVAVHEEIHEAIFSSKLVIIETCGHLSALDQPEQVTHVLRQWIQQTKT